MDSEVSAMSRAIDLGNLIAILKNPVNNHQQ